MAQKVVGWEKYERLESTNSEDFCTIFYGMPHHMNGLNKQAMCFINAELDGAASLQIEVNFRIFSWTQL